MADTSLSLTHECQAIATQLSAQTGHTWTLAAQDPEHWHRLHGPDSACVNLHRVCNHAERLRIKGVFPQGPNREDCLPYPTQLPAITVARARGAEAISRDIVRRFLPPYTELLQQAQARKAQLDADDAAQHALMDRLVAHACVEAPSGGGEGLPGQAHLGGLARSVPARVGTGADHRSRCGSPGVAWGARSPRPSDFPRLGPVDLAGLNRNRMARMRSIGPSASLKETSS